MVDFLQVPLEGLNIIRPGVLVKLRFFGLIGLNWLNWAISVSRKVKVVETSDNNQDVYFEKIIGVYFEYFCSDPYSSS